MTTIDPSANVIHHLVWRRDWETGQRDGWYRASSLESEGFIHATKELDRALEVAGMFFKPGEDELLLVELDEAKVGSPVRYEDPGVGHLFPHVYGPIALDAVRSVRTLVWRENRWQPGDADASQ